MKVSIITVCFNSSDTIEESIRSVVEQDHHDVEYIVIDGGSTDGSLEIIQKYKHQIAHLVSEKDEGFYFGLNKGIALATGDLVSQLNSDDFYMNDHVISKMVKTLEKANADCAYADLVFVDPENTDKVVRYWRSGNYKTNAFIKGWMPCHPTFFIKRTFIKQFGAYNTTLRLSADYEFMLRMIHKNGLVPAYLPETIIKMRTGGLSSKSIRNRLSANKEDRRAWELNGLSPGAFTILMKPISKVRQFLVRPD